MCRFGYVPIYIRHHFSIGSYARDVDELTLEHNIFIDKDRDIYVLVGMNMTVPTMDNTTVVSFYIPSSAEVARMYTTHKVRAEAANKLKENQQPLEGEFVDQKLHRKLDRIKRKGRK